MDLNHPAVQSAVLPLLVGLLATGVLRLAGGNDYGPRLASVAIGLGVLVAGLLILGMPPWPPLTALQKLPYLLAASLTLGILLELNGTLRTRFPLILALWPLAVCGWLAAGRWLHLESSLLLKLLLLYAGALLVLGRLHTLRDAGSTPAVMVLCVALGLGAVAFSTSLVLGQLAFALAAATGGFLLWNWPQPRYGFGYAGVFGAGGAVLTLAAQSLLLTPVSPWALACLLPILFADRISQRLPPTEPGWLRQALAPVYLVLVALLPIVLAILVGQWAAGGAVDLYYR